MALMGHGVTWAFKDTTGDPSTTSFAAGATRFALVSDSVHRNAPVVDGRGIMGTRGKVKGRARVPMATYEGALVFELSPAILDFFIVYMMHDSNGATPFELAETVDQEFDFLRSDGATIYWYTNVHVMSWTIKGASGGIVELTLNVAAKLEVVTGEAGAQAMPALTLGTGDEDEPMLAGETSISIGGSVRVCDDYEITIDHGIEVKQRNSVNPTDFLPGMRTVTFTTNTVWSATVEDDLYRGDQDGFAATITMTRDAMSSVFTITSLVVPDNAPSVSGPGELLYGIQGVAKGALPVSSAKEISVTVDATP